MKEALRDIIEITVLTVVTAVFLGGMMIVSCGLTISIFELLF